MAAVPAHHKAAARPGAAAGAGLQPQRPCEVCPTPGRVADALPGPPPGNRAVASRTTSCVAWARSMLSSSNGMAEARSPWSVASHAAPLRASTRPGSSPGTSSSNSPRRCRALAEVAPRGPERGQPVGQPTRQAGPPGGTSPGPHTEVAVFQFQQVEPLPWPGAARWTVDLWPCGRTARHGPRGWRRRPAWCPAARRRTRGRSLASRSAAPARTAPQGAASYGSTSCSSASRTGTPRRSASAQTASMLSRLMPPRNTEAAASRRRAASLSRS